MLVELPITTSERIAAEFRPARRGGSVQGVLRTLKARRAVSGGLSEPLRAGSGGRVGGKLTLYSALNLDAAKCARAGDYERAAEIAGAAAGIERSPEMRRLARALADSMSVDGGGASRQLARAVGRAEKETHEVLRLLSERTARERADLDASEDLERMFGRVSAVEQGFALVRLEQGAQEFRMRRRDLEQAESLFVGAPVAITVEELGPGKTLMSTSAALDLDGEEDPRGPSGVEYPYDVPLPDPASSSLVLDTIAGVDATIRRPRRRIHIDG